VESSTSEDGSRSLYWDSLGARLLVVLCRRASSILVVAALVGLGARFLARLSLVRSVWVDKVLFGSSRRVRRQVVLRDIGFLGGVAIVAVASLASTAGRILLSW